MRFVDSAVYESLIQQRIYGIAERTYQRYIFV
jgi:hypothetical protein